MNKTNSTGKKFKSAPCIESHIVGSFRMTGTGENVGECRFANVGKTNEAHLEIILHATKSCRTHELGVVAFAVLLLILRWHGLRCALVGGTRGYEDVAT
jgi:hypothetical protein